MFQRLVEGRRIESGNPADIWPDWRGKDESWLFMSPHDDDIVCGCGLTFLSALKIGVKTSAGVVTNGKMGYCRPEQKETIAAIRREECAASFKMLGLPEENLHFLHFFYCECKLCTTSSSFCFIVIYQNSHHMV